MSKLRFTTAKLILINWGNGYRHLLYYNSKNKKKFIQTSDKGIKVI